MKREVKVVRDPERVKLAIEDTRSDILSLLRVNDMTLSQMAESLNKDHSTIYRHVKKLEKAGYLEEVGEIKDHHIPKKVYSRTANVFLLSPRSIDGRDPSEIGMDWERRNAEKILSLLDVMGYDIEDKEEALIEEISRFFIELQERVTEPIGKIEEDIGEISYPLLLRFKLLLFLLEEKEDEDLKERMENFLSNIKKN